MTTVVSTVDIARPIGDVFDVLTNVENTARWFPAEVEEHWTSPPPHGVGSTRHAVLRMFGRRVENDAVATEYLRPHRAVMAGTTPNAPFVTTLAFEEIPIGTRVTATTEFRFKGVAQRAVGVVMVRWLRDSWDRGLLQVKALMESGAL